MPEHIVLAYSGGLDTSVMTHWLAQTYDADVTCVMIDLGQGGQAIEAAQQRAIDNGAAECLILPATQALAEGFIAPAIKANAVYEDAYPLATALGRPLIAAHLAQTAQQVGADAVAHGCTGKGNDQVRIETSLAALAPELTCLAPQRTDAMTRDQALAYAQANGLSLPDITGSPYSVDENLWGRSVEGGDLEDPSQPVPEAAYAWTTAPTEAPDQALEVSITFTHGLPTALDGQPLDLVDLIDALNHAMGLHGIGRIDHVENRLVGIKSREVYEAPAAQSILTAKQALETMTLTRPMAQLAPMLSQRLAELVYDGLWYTPTRQAISAFFDQATQPVTGTVTLQAHKGSLTVTGRQAEASLYDHALASYGAEDAFDHDAASGFIDIWSLPVATAAQATAEPQDDDGQVLPVGTQAPGGG